MGGVAKVNGSVVDEDGDRRISKRRQLVRSGMSEGCGRAAGGEVVGTQRSLRVDASSKSFIHLTQGSQTTVKLKPQCCNC